MSGIELVAAAFGLISVWLTKRQNIWCWPTGLVMVVLYVWIFAQAKLYSDMDDAQRYFPEQPDRERFFETCKAALERHRCHYMVIRGDHESRFQTAREAVEQLLKAGGTQ